MVLMNTSFFFRAAKFGAVLLFATQSIAAALDLTFPTKNRALLEGDGEVSVKVTSVKGGQATKQAQ